VASGIVTQRALERVRVEAQIKNRVRSRLKVASEEYEKASNAGVFEEFLSVVWMLEWMLGPEIFDTPQYANTLWAIRIDAIDQLVKRAHDEGRAFDIRTMIWETCLGLWMVKERDYVRAEPLTWNSMQKWRALVEPLNPEDPWLDHVAALHACAQLDRFLAERNAEELSPEDHAFLRELARAMERSDGRLQELDTNSPLEELITQRLMWIYGPDLLDEPELRAETETRWTDDYL
jgi:hypothetical protein